MPPPTYSPTGYTLFEHKLSCLLRQLSKAAEKKSCAYAEAVTAGMIVRKRERETQSRLE